MTAKLSEEGNRCVIRLDGRLDTSSAGEAGRIFADAAAQHSEVVLDLAGISYVSSAGIRVLRDLYAAIYQKKGHLQMINAGSSVLDVLEMTGLLELLDSETA